MKFSTNWFYKPYLNVHITEPHDAADKISRKICVFAFAYFRIKKKTKTQKLKIFV